MRLEIIDSITSLFFLLLVETNQNGKFYAIKNHLSSSKSSSSLYRNNLTDSPLLENHKNQQNLTLTQLNLNVPIIKEDDGFMELWPEIDENSSINFEEGDTLDRLNVLNDQLSSMNGLNRSDDSFFRNSINSSKIKSNLFLGQSSMNKSTETNSIALSELSNLDSIEDVEIDSYFQQNRHQTIQPQQSIKNQSNSNLPPYTIQNNSNQLPQIFSSSANNRKGQWICEDNDLVLKNDVLLVRNKSINSSTLRNCNKQISYHNKLPIEAAAISTTIPSTMANLNAYQIKSDQNQLNALTLLENINSNNNRIRNNSMSTDVSSHDEGFASQPEDDIDDLDSNVSTSPTISHNNPVENDPLNAVVLNNLLGEKLDINGSVYLIDQAQPIVVGAIAESNITDPTKFESTDTTSTSIPILIDPNQLKSFSNVPNDSAIKNETLNFDLNQSSSNEMQSRHHSTLADVRQTKRRNQTNKKGSNLNVAVNENDDFDDFEDDEDDDDESFYGDYDASDLIGACISDDMENKWSLNMGRTRKGNNKRYFWQYNVQSKGPKGPKFSPTSFDENDDPHVFNEISDPVFAPDCQVEGVKHSGKARKGDGNDLTANPRKLLMIGLELKKLSEIINDLTPVTELPFVCRNNSRKEKNKLASRACRLKKKAQHEANKIKLYGLHREHGRMIKKIQQIRHIIEIGLRIKESNFNTLEINVDDVQFYPKNCLDLAKLLEKINVKNTNQFDIAGNTATFVNHILDNVTLGSVDGGLNNY